LYVPGSRSQKAARPKKQASLPVGPILDWEQAADYLGVTVRWMRRAVLERRVTFVKMGGLVRFKREDLDAYIEQQRVESRRRK
jgi:excisionase family DNA binding protein